MTKDMHAGDSAPEWGGRAHTGRGSIFFGGRELRLEKTGYLGSGSPLYTNTPMTVDASILAVGEGTAN